MGRIIAIANQKGGVGKTTTAINLSACLAEAGQRVLTVDFDPQGNATSGLGFEKGYMDKTVYELLMEECSIEECIISDVQENLDVLPSDVDLAGAEIELLDEPDKESMLRKELKKVEEDYDFIIIDCPPSLNLLTINALTAANTVLVPIQCELCFGRFKPDNTNGGFGKKEVKPKTGTGRCCVYDVRCQDKPFFRSGRKCKKLFKSSNL